MPEGSVRWAERQDFPGVNTEVGGRGVFFPGVTWKSGDLTTRGKYGRGFIQKRGGGKFCVGNFFPVEPRKQRIFYL